MGSSTSDAAHRRDGRLLVPACATWLGAAISVGALGSAPGAQAAGRWATLLVIVSVIALASLMLVAGAWRIARPGRRVGGVAGYGFLAAAFLAISTAAAGAWVATALDSPVAAWIEQRATTVAVGEVTAEARVRTLRSAAGFGPRTWQEAPMTARALLSRGVEVTGSVPLVLRLPATSAAPPPGSLVRVRGRLGTTSWQRGAVARLQVSGVDVLQAPGPVATLAQDMRDGLRASVASVGPDAGSLVAGLAVGDESGQSGELREAMRASGLSHLTAVSGGNVAIVMGAVLLLARWLQLRLWLQIAVALAVLAYYVVLVGPEPSVLRAGVMGAIVVGSLLTGGRGGGPSVLSAGVIGLVLMQPWLALSWGFALSVTATAGLVLLAPPLADRLGRVRGGALLGSRLTEAVTLTLAAQLATLPLLIGMGGAAGWVAVPANVAAMPVVPVVTILGLAAAVLSPLLPALGVALGWLAAWPAGWIALVARVAPQLPLSGLPWPTGWAGVGLLAASGGLGFLAWSVRRRVPHPLHVAGIVGLVLLLVMAVLEPPARRGWPPPGWFALMCDVGQGDMLLLPALPGSAVVVDTGPDPDAADRCLREAGIDSVPLLVLTHFHADHVGGLAGVLRHRAIGRVVASPLDEPADEAVQTRRQLAAAGVVLTSAVAGDRWQVGPLDIHVLAPRRRITAGSAANNTSVVLEARVGERRVLLTGDIETEGQVAVAPDLDGLYDVVKVPHHGSARQWSGLPRAAPAAVALISVGADNGYGQPADRTVEAWQSAGALVIRSDESGDAAVIPRGTSVGVVKH
ncbi:MAG: MBL fold metallo-hydrolase [Actinomycetales bacterium]|nr:MBL fold metallo-hydrolase [Actinomycetales bacterium]